MGGIHRGAAVKTDYWYKFQSATSARHREFATLRSAKKWIKLKRESGRVLEFQIVGMGSNTYNGRSWTFTDGELDNAESA